MKQVKKETDYSKSNQHMYDTLNRVRLDNGDKVRVQFTNNEPVEKFVRIISETLDYYESQNYYRAFVQIEDGSWVPLCANGILVEKL